MYKVLFFFNCLVLASLDLIVTHLNLSATLIYQSLSHPLHPFFLPGELQYSPAALQQRMAAELQYLESIEESVRQLGDVERLMGVSMAQQESVSLAQMFKVMQNSVVFIYISLLLWATKRLGYVFICG